MPNALWIHPILAAVVLYAAAGVVVGGIALYRLAPQADPAFRTAPKSLRLLLLPGAVAVWPLAVVRWRRTIRSTP